MPALAQMLRKGLVRKTPVHNLRIPDCVGSNILFSYLTFMGSSIVQLVLEKNFVEVEWVFLLLLIFGFAKYFKTQIVFRHLV